MAAGGRGGGLERLRDGRAHVYYDKCVGEPRGATCGVLLAACRFTCVSRPDLAPSPLCNSPPPPPPPPHAMAEEEPTAARLQSLVQDQMERELAPLRDQIASLADLLKQKQETGGGESMRGLYLVLGGPAGGAAGGLPGGSTPRGGTAGAGSSDSQLRPIPQVSTEACRAASCWQGCARWTPARASTRRKLAKFLRIPH